MCVCCSCILISFLLTLSLWIGMMKQNDLPPTTLVVNAYKWLFFPFDEYHCSNTNQHLNLTLDLAAVFPEISKDTLRNSLQHFDK